MRFVLAIAALVVAAVLIVLGLAQRTVFLGPETLSMETTVEGDLPYTVIDGEVLGAHPGQQSITVSGSDQVFVAYGRTSDVLAWIGADDYNAIGIDEEAGTLTSTVVEPEVEEPGPDAPGGETPDATAPDETAQPDDADPAGAADPRGSDLWYAEYSEEQAVLTTINVPSDVSVIIASDGTEPAPSDVRLSWPLNNATPWAGPLIALGILLLLVGIVLYFLGLRHMRRSRGPRRKSITSAPVLDDIPALPGGDSGAGTAAKPRGRKSKGKLPKRPKRRAMTAVLPVVLGSTLVLAGCSSDYWPDLSVDETPTATPTPTNLPDDAESEQAPPVVTVRQLERIVARIGSTVADADNAMDGDLAGTRLTGPALAERTANYAIRARQADAAPPPAIPGSPVTLTLPQASDSWPRTVMTVVQDPTDDTVAPTAMVLVQQTPRENYRVEYSVRLEPDAQVPDVAPATIGATLVPPELEFLLIAPDQLAAAYADVITNGDQSTSQELFESDGDTLRAAIAADREAKRANLPTTASIDFQTAPGEGQPQALVTNESGAIVAVDIVEKETVKPVEAEAKVKLSGAVAALSGLTETTKGIESTYGDQLLFYVPPAGSTDKIVLLGFSQSLVSAKELP